jgi:hypothetical protein
MIAITHKALPPPHIPVSLYGQRYLYLSPASIPLPLWLPIIKNSSSREMRVRGDAKRDLPVLFLKVNFDCNLAGGVPRRTGRQ